MSNKQKIIVIVGPTGSGKSSIAFDLCKRFNGSVISADSRQVYKGMDIGTGKEDKKNSSVQVEKSKWVVNNIDVYGYDVISPGDDFSVSQYEKTVVNKFLPKIIKNGELPFLVGGTGFYVKAIIDGIDTIDIAPNQALREKLENELQKSGVEVIYQELVKVNPEKAKEIDKNNPRRIVRAIEIEIAYQSGYKPKSREISFHPLFIGINWKREKLYERIDSRVDWMIENGLIKEIKKLLQKGCNWETPAMNSIGYIEFKPYFDNKADIEECVQKLKWNTHSYARRQLIWFNKNKRIQWFDRGEKCCIDEISNLSGKFIND